MKKIIILFKASIVLAILSCFSAVAQVAPPGWTDFQIGLVNDNSNNINVRMKKALSENVKLHYRYAYVNNGVDPNTNALSWLFNQWGTDYSKNSIAMGLRPAYVIYMLQEEGGASALKNNIMNATFMRNYFTSIRIVAEKSNGYKSMFVIEPDTWGYFLQNALEQGTQSDPRLITANINNLGAGYEYLSDLPNTLSGVAQGVIRTIRRYAPDAYCGLLMSFWSVSSNGATGPPTADGAKGMVYWNQSDVDYSAKRNADFANQLLSATDRGDFIGVEKNGWSAGNWLVKQNRNDYYWNDAQNAKWVSWSKTLKQHVNLPLLGWQISIGHIGLPNTVNRYEDTFMPYFFSHVQEFINAGFIGFLAGKGLADCTDFTNLNGNELEANGNAGDNGWFFEKLKTFDAGRPYLGTTSGPSITITSPSSGATFTPGTAITIATNVTVATGCSVTKVEFFQGTQRLGEDVTAPYTFPWTVPLDGSYALTAKITDTCGGTATSPVVNVVSLTPATLPSPWVSAGVGSVTPAGSATYTNGTFTVKGAGADIWGNADAFHYVYQPVNGNVEIIARIASLTNTDGWAKGGVMIRETIAANSKHAMVAATASNGVAFQRRASTAGVSEHTASTGTVPVWLKLTRVDNLFTASQSTNGTTWTTIGTATITMTSSVLVGLPLTSHLNGTLTTATFTNVNVSAVNANINPTASIKKPLNAAILTASCFTVEADAADADGTIAKVELYVDGNIFATDTTLPYTFEVCGLSAGTHTLAVKATDNQAGTFTSNAISITQQAENVSPTASISKPLSGATISTACFSVEANAADADGTIVKVELYVDGNIFAIDTTLPYTFEVCNLATGNHTLAVKATDNQAASFMSTAITIVKSGANSNPMVSIISPANNQTFAGPVSIDILASASDADGIASVEYFKNGESLAVRTTSPYLFYWINVTAGVYEITAKATDNTGLSTTSLPIKITVTGPADGCTTISQYVSTGVVYNAGNRVKNGGSQYECKPWPFSGWCSAGPAYEPGVGFAWQDAWTFIGNCLSSGSARSSEFTTESMEEEADGLDVFPTLGTSNNAHTVKMVFNENPGSVQVNIHNVNGLQIDDQFYKNNKRTIDLKVPSLPEGLYIIKVKGENKTWMKKYFVRE
jgi:hypothetical protein